MKDTNAKFITAGKGEGGIIKKMVDGVLKEYQTFEDEPEDIEELDEVLDELDDGREIYIDEPPVKKPNRMENQVLEAYNQQKGILFDKYIDKVLNHPQIKSNLYKDWHKDNDFLNVISSKVVEVSNGRLIFETVKQSIKERYE